MPRLVINPGTPSAWEVQLRPGTNLLGRGFANDFKIDHPSVSGSHAQIIVENGTVIIKDLGSTNGTYVNRAPVTETKLTQLAFGKTPACSSRRPTNAPRQRCVL